MPPRAKAGNKKRGLVPVVGIGASAGGLEALKAFFGAMPPKTGLSFVVVVHLDPTHESLMPELLARSTTLGVEHARNRQPLLADHVYIIPPNHILTVHQGSIRLAEASDRRGLRGVIDHFFRSLAGDRHEKAIAIVLSGTGTEGTLGLRAIKAEGGLVMAQTPETASQPGMPASAIATGLVDFTLAPAEMPKTLLEFARAAREHHATAPETPDAKPPNGLHSILAVLRARTKYDFRGYKKGTLQRRIERRMGLHQIGTVDEYLDFLRGHAVEADRLLKDLLIGVTSFFRDSAAFEELETTVLSALVRAKGADDNDPDLGTRLRDGRGGLLAGHRRGRADLGGAVGMPGADLRHRRGRATRSRSRAAGCIRTASRSTCLLSV